MNQSVARSSAASAILKGGLTVGVLDTLLAMGLWQIGPVIVYQSVASGLLGRESYRGGLATAALGMLLHFLIATTAAAVYWFASRKMTVLVRHWFVCGLAFGVAVYYFMQLIVLPLSNVIPGHPPLWRVIGSIVGHAFLVGLPIAWFAHKSDARCRDREHIREREPEERVR
jgi:hypothetical protein